MNWYEKLVKNSETGVNSINMGVNAIRQMFKVLESKGQRGEKEKKKRMPLKHKDTK